MHPHLGCFATSLNHKIDPFVPSASPRSAPTATPGSRSLISARSRAQRRRMQILPRRSHCTEEMKRIWDDYQRLPREFVDLHDPQLAATYKHFIDESALQCPVQIRHTNSGEEVIAGGGPRCTPKRRASTSL